MAIARFIMKLLSGERWRKPKCGVEVGVGAGRWEVGWRQELPHSSAPRLVAWTYRHHTTLHSMGDGICRVCVVKKLLRKHETNVVKDSAVRHDNVDSAACESAH